MGGDAHPPSLPWSHFQLFQGLDWRAVRRGKEVYEQVFAPCHSLSYIKYRHFEAFMSKEEVKVMAASFEVDDDPDEKGEPRKRPAKRFDSVVQPYTNEQAARYANNGALPPDLSLITNARHGGVDYIYALLNSYHRPVPGGLQLSPTQWYNPYFHGGIIGMPPPLADDMLEFEDGTPASIPQMAKDVSIFLEWCSNPWWDERKLIGYKVIASLAVVAVSSGYYNRFLSGIWRSRRIAWRPINYAK